MVTNATPYNLPVSKSPLINVRNAFNLHFGLLKSPQFCRQFTGNKVGIIHLPYLVWGAMPNALLTYMLREAILGLEAYVPGACFFQAGSRGLLDGQLQLAIRDASILHGSNMADNIYNRLPALIETRWALKVREKALWKELVKFYSDVRNPIFHGHELARSAPAEVLEAYKLLWRVYKWVDAWHPPGAFWPGTEVLGKEPGPIAFPPVSAG